MAKRLFDCTVALVGLLLLLPLFALAAIAIKIDSPGPVLYRARRVGKGGRPLAMIKFRTMTDGPDRDAGPRVTAEDDPRITRLGRLLRSTKINELPQLLNVLKGEMSLVGPRPEDPEFVAQYTEEQREVLCVLPGVTSPASVLYCNEERLLSYATASDSYLAQILPTKLRLDLLYVRRRSFLLDLDVLLRTGLALAPRFGRAVPEAAQVFAGPVQRLVREHVPWFAIDWLTSCAAVAAAGLLWRTSGPLDLGWNLALLVGLAIALAFSATNLVLGVQRTAWRYASAQESLDVAASTSLATLGLIGGQRLILPGPPLPSGMLLLAGFFALAGFLITRYRSRLYAGLRYRWAHLRGMVTGDRERVLVIGGGEAGQLMVWLLQHGAGAQAFQVIGIVDDDLWKAGTRIHHVAVMGDRSRIAELVRAHDVGLIVFAIHNIEPQERQALLDLCRATPARTVQVPDAVAMLREAAGMEREQEERPRRREADLEVEQAPALPVATAREG